MLGKAKKIRYEKTRTPQEDFVVRLYSKAMGIEVAEFERRAVAHYIRHLWQSANFKLQEKIINEEYVSESRIKDIVKPGIDLAKKTIEELTEMIWNRGMDKECLRHLVTSYVLNRITDSTEEFIEKDYLPKIFAQVEKANVHLEGLLSKHLVHLVEERKTGPIVQGWKDGGRKDSHYGPGDKVPPWTLPTGIDFN
jgi:hypothetical protein